MFLLQLQYVGELRKNFDAVVWALCDDVPPKLAFDRQISMATDD